MKPVFILFLFFPFIAICQIDIMQQSNAAFVKPRQFDSLYNYNISPDWDMREIIGQKITFLPYSSKFKPTDKQDNFCECYVEKPMAVRTSQSYQDDSLMASYLKGMGPQGTQQTSGISVSSVSSLFHKKDKSETDNMKQYRASHPYTSRDSLYVFNYKPVLLPKQRGSQRGDVYVTDALAVANKTFTITDAIYNKQDVSGRRKIQFYGHSPYDVYFKLKSEETGDTLLLGVQQVREHSRGPAGVGPFVINGYYTKLKNMYTGHKFYARKKTDAILISHGNETVNLLMDAYTGEKLAIDSTNQEWVCEKVTFVDNDWSQYPVLSLLLKNGARYFALDVSAQDGDMANSEYFKTEKEFNYEKMVAAERERMKKEEMEAAERQRIEDSVSLEKIHKDNIAKYGTRIGKLINEGKVIIGMTKDQCSKAWGDPAYVNTTTTANNVYEQWVYGSSYLYFTNNSLTDIQN